MNRGIDRGMCLLAGYCVTLAAIVAGALQVARAQDEPPVPPPALVAPGAHARQVLIADFSPTDSGPRILIITGGSPVGQLFTAGCNGPTFCEEVLQRLTAARPENDCPKTFITERFFHVDPACGNECAAGQCESSCPTLSKSGDVLIHRHPSADFPVGTKQTIVLSRVELKPGDVIDTRDVRNVERRLKAAQLVVGPPPDWAPAAEATAKFIRLVCPCIAEGECACASHASCGEECAAGKASACKCCPCAAEAAAATEAKCGEECEVENVIVRHVQHEEEADEYHPLKLMQHIAGLVGAKAAAEAALDVRKQADEQIGEIYEAMSELLADNAALDAKLEAQTEFHAEQRKLLEKVADLAAENARLKAHVELAAERAEVARSALALTLENERLKLHLAALEQKHAETPATQPVYSRVIAKYPDGRVEIQEEAVRTAAKPRNERKAR